MAGPEQQKTLPPTTQASPTTTAPAPTSISPTTDREPPSANPAKPGDPRNQPTAPPERAPNGTPGFGDIPMCAIPEQKPTLVGNPKPEKPTVDVTASEPPAELSGEPDAVANWWKQLPSEERDKIVKERPEWVGNVDGVAATDRDRANRAQIPIERARLENERDQLQQNLDDNLFGGTFTNDDAKKWYVEEKLNDLDTIESVFAKGTPDAPRLLLLLDMKSGERGHAAVAVGNPDTADHVSVATPGLGTTINNALDGGRRYDGMAGEAEMLRTETGRQLDLADRGYETVATIAWLGYDAPNATGPGNLDAVRGGVDVGSASKANATAPILARFFNGLDAASVKEDPHIVAYGHSYGSLVTAEALRKTGGSVDEAVFYGSPGLGGDPVNLHPYQPSDFNLTRGQMYLLENGGDPVADFGRFGADPSMFGDFTRMSTHAGTDKTNVPRIGGTGHSDYLRPGYGSDGQTPELRMAAYNMAAVLGALSSNVIEGD
ncbi:MAG: alpha/beta hydrolase [Gordonia sp. (in: high G+C Gram-positive bacteria)]